MLLLDSMDALGNFLVGFLGLCGWVDGWGRVGIHLLYTTYEYRHNGTTVPVLCDSRGGQKHSSNFYSSNLSSNSLKTAELLLKLLFMSDARSES